MTHSVFISSTCYDLADLRMELSEYLRAQGFIVKLSDDPGSAFEVSPDCNSVETCLRNAESSDAIVCIIDSRYGGVMRDGDYKDKSATEAEVIRATMKGVPLFIFIRGKALSEYQQLRANSDFQTKWVEKGSKPEQIQRWFKFVQSLVTLGAAPGKSNWYDEFDTSFDLKPIVLKRLTDHFPNHRGTLAMMPDRLVRITFEYHRSQLNGEVIGAFKNVGIGPALNIRHGVREGAAPLGTYSCGAIREGERIATPGKPDFWYRITPEKGAPALFCEYENRFRDRYRVDVKLFWSAAGWQVSSEEFLPDPPSMF